MYNKKEITLYRGGWNNLPSYISYLKWEVIRHAPSSPNDCDFFLIVLLNLDKSEAWIRYKNHPLFLPALLFIFQLNQLLLTRSLCNWFYSTLYCWLRNSSISTLRGFLLLFCVLSCKTLFSTVIMFLFLQNSSPFSGFYTWRDELSW